jgi:hypothetical protein
LFEAALAQNFAKELVGKLSLTVLRSGRPLLEHDPLDPSHRFLFRNASVSDAIQVPPQQLLFLLRT